MQNMFGLITYIVMSLNLWSHDKTIPVYLDMDWVSQFSRDDKIKIYSNKEKFVKLEFSKPRLCEITTYSAIDNHGTK